MRCTSLSNKGYIAVYTGCTSLSIQGVHHCLYRGYIAVYTGGTDL